MAFLGVNVFNIYNQLLCYWRGIDILYRMLGPISIEKQVYTLVGRSNKGNVKKIVITTDMHALLLIYQFIWSRGLDYKVKSMLDSMLVNKDFLTWILIG